jgi:sulfite reductase alpha subunit-like flavoprotein
MKDYYVTHSLKVHLCVAVTMTKTPYGRMRSGVCSNYLASLSTGDQVLLYIRSGLLKLPILSLNSNSSDNKRPPMILIGPGTGVAPMRALLQERNLLDLKFIKNLDKATTVSVKNLLFFGCRSRDNDYLYGREWIINSRENNAVINDIGELDSDEFQGFGNDQKVIVAFSRDQQQKVYVTDKIRKEAKMVWKLLQEVHY